MVMIENQRLTLGQTVYGLDWEYPRFRFAVTVVRGGHRERWGGCLAAHMPGVHLYWYVIRRHLNPNLANLQTCFIIGLLTFPLAFYDDCVPMSKIAELHVATAGHISLMRQNPAIPPNQTSTHPPETTTWTIRQSSTTRSQTLVTTQSS